MSKHTYHQIVWVANMEMKTAKNTSYSLEVVKE